MTKYKNKDGIYLTYKEKYTKIRNSAIEEGKKNE